MQSIKKFDVSKGVRTGGITGSKRVVHKEENHPYQLKGSIQDAPTLRKIKAGSTDRENFGEVIAAKIGYSFLGENKVPDVQLVYDEFNKRVLIASKYLESNEIPPQTLNDYLAEISNLPAGKKHIKVVSKYTPTTPGWVRMSDEVMEPLLPSLADAIAVSVLTGDHDINPGNMMVIHEGDPPTPTVARIDFGHAFNDLLNAPAFFGGKLKDQEHPTLDFFNRTSIAGFPSEAPSKLWRDYPGLIPSRELADAMLRLTDDGEAKLKMGVLTAKQEFADLLNTQYRYRDTVGIQHTLASLNAIYENITDKKLRLPPLDDDSKVTGFLDDFFQAIENNGLKSLTDMQRTAKIMHLQMDVDSMIEFEKLNLGKPRSAFEDELNALNDHLQEEYEAIDPNNDGIEWVKNDAQSPPFKGNYEDYVKNRKPVLGELLSKMEACDEEYKQRVDNQLFSKSRDGSLKQQFLNKAITKSMRHIKDGDLNLAELEIQKTKGVIKNFFGESNFLGVRSTAYTILEDLERDIKQAKEILKAEAPQNKEDVVMH